MAKTNAESGGATLLEEPADYYRPPDGQDSAARPSHPARAKADPEDAAGEPFLRARRRVPVRRGLLPGWTRTVWGKVGLVAGIFVIPGLLLALIIAVTSFLHHDPRFRIDSSASIQTFGNSQLSRTDLLAVFGSDIGRNLFYVSLAKRRTALEQIPWVQQATVMRLLPNQLRVAVTERTPIAFVRLRGNVDLVDAEGVILTLPPRQMESRHYSFPVLSGINPADTLPVRAARMQLYQRFIGELDSSGEHFSSHLSEVDLSDPEDVRATVTANGSVLLLHFGDDDFLARWRNYQAHVAEWEQQYPHLASVDLRYDREVVLKMAGDPGTNAAAGANQQKPTATRTAPAAMKSQSAVPVQHKASAQHLVKTHKPQAAKHPPVKTRHTLQVKAHSSRRSG
ncbi:MAG: cell division protein FtsQ/DivIB [Acidobacteriota bacterium]